MEVDFKRRKKEGIIYFKLYGILSCKKCADKWKKALMDKGKKVRLRKGEKGWEIWVI
jgi:hypothetical protein